MAAGLNDWAWWMQSTLRIYFMSCCRKGPNDVISVWVSQQNVPVLTSPNRVAIKLIEYHFSRVFTKAACTIEWVDSKITISKITKITVRLLSVYYLSWHSFNVKWCLFNVKWCLFCICIPTDIIRRFWYIMYRCCDFTRAAVTSCCSSVWL